MPGNRIRSIAIANALLWGHQASGRICDPTLGRRRSFLDLSAPNPVSLCALYPSSLHLEKITSKDTSGVLALNSGIDAANGASRV